MKLILSATEASLANAWEKFCEDLDFVMIHRGSILDVNCDGVVSPANSFGFMDVDALYMDYFGSDIQMIVRRQIFEQHGGELIIGNADLVETGSDKIPFLIVAPTMRVLMVRRDSVNPYLAARAVFRLIKEGLFLTGQFKGQRIGDHINQLARPDSELE